MRYSIFSYLPSEDISDLRLVCRVLKHVGTEYLDARTYICVRRTSFKDLVRLSSSDFRKSIRSLCYDADRFIDCYDFAEWDQIARPSLDMTRKARLKAYDRFLYYFSDQGALLQKGMHTKSPTAFFQGCRNLDTIEIRSAYPSYEFPDRSQPLFRSALISPGRVQGNSMNGVSALVDVVQIVQQTSACIKRISAGRVSHKLFSLDDEDMEPIKATVVPLHCFALSLHDDVCDAEMLQLIREKLDRGVLSDILSTCSNLSHPSVQSSQSVSIELHHTHIFANHIFQRIRSLDLNGISVNTVRFREVLEDYGKTLENICLTNIHSIDFYFWDAWATFFSSLSRTFPRACRVMFYGDWTSLRSTTWTFGSQAHDQSTLKTHAMDKFVRKGGVFPDSYEHCCTYVREPQSTARRNPSRHTRTRADRERDSEYMHIEEPDTDTEMDDEQDRDVRFWATHL